MGYDRFLMGLYRHPDSIHKLMKVAAETTVAWIEAQRDVIGSDLLTFISGDTDNFLNPVQFKAFSYPYISSVCKKLRKKRNVVLYHNDGDTTHLLDDLGEVGANMFSYGQGMRTAVVKEKVGRKMGLVGGLNSIGAMLNGKAEDVKAEARNATHEGAVDGGFVLSNEGGMGSHTPLGEHSRDDRECQGIRAISLELLTESSALVDRSTGSRWKHTYRAGTYAVVEEIDHHGKEERDRRATPPTNGLVARGQVRHVHPLGDLRRASWSMEGQKDTGNWRMDHVPRQNPR